MRIVTLGRPALFMARLRASTTTRFYDVDDEDRPRRKRRGRDPLRDFAKLILLFLGLWLLFHALGRTH